MKRATFLLLALALLSPAVLGQSKYEKPPKEILDVLHAPLPPIPSLSPTHDAIVFAQPLRYPPISDLAEPMLRLAGIRINPRTNAERSYPNSFTELTLKKLPDGAATSISLPGKVRAGYPDWNANGTAFALTNETADRVELWVVDVSTGKPRLIPGLRINPLLQWAIQWMPDQKTLLVKVVPSQRVRCRSRRPFPPDRKSRKARPARCPAAPMKPATS